MKRYLVEAGGDVIPQRLHVVDLVFDRKTVKPRRWQRQRISHGTCPEYTTAAWQVAGRGRSPRRLRDSHTNLGCGGVALTPSALNELRDRGLLAYHLNDVTGALRDREAREEHNQIWEHVKTLRRRVAALN